METPITTVDGLAAAAASGQTIEYLAPEHDAVWYPLMESGSNRGEHVTNVREWGAGWLRQGYKFRVATFQGAAR